MPLPTKVKVALQFAALFGLTAFVVAYSVCGIVSNVTISILFGIFELALGGYYGYLVYSKKDAGMRLRVFYGIVAAASLLSALTNFAMHGTYYTEKTSVARWFLVFFVAFGLVSNASVPYTLFTERFMKEVILDCGFDEFTEQVIYLAVNTVVVIIHAFIIASFGQKTELEMLRIVAVRSIGTCFVGVVAGAVLGFFMGSKAGKGGYTQQNEA